MRAGGCGAAEQIVMPKCVHNGVHFMLTSAGRILIVDDDPVLRQMVRTYMEDHSVPAASVSNRIELNRFLEGSPPSLIILDLRLGQDDGQDLLREIRSHSDVPVIIATGHRPDDMERVGTGLMAGCLIVALES
jgi:two-component system, OmpR family, response regulator